MFEKCSLTISDQRFSMSCSLNDELVSGNDFHSKVYKSDSFCVCVVCFTELTNDLYPPDSSQRQDEWKKQRQMASIED